MKSGFLGWPIFNAGKKYFYCIITLRKQILNLGIGYRCHGTDNPGWKLFNLGAKG